MATQDDLKALIKSIPAGVQLFQHVDQLVDQRKVMTAAPSGAQLVDESAWLYESRRYHYFVGLCSLICVTDMGSVLYWTVNGGEPGFADAHIHASIYRTVSAIRTQLAQMTPPSNSFRHPLNLPPEIYLIEDPVAATVAADTYKRYL